MPFPFLGVSCPVVAPVIPESLVIHRGRGIPVEGEAQPAPASWAARVQPLPFPTVQQLLGARFVRAGIPWPSRPGDVQEEGEVEVGVGAGEGEEEVGHLGLEMYG